MANPNQNLVQQNNLLANQNKLLEQMNNLLMVQNSALHSDEVFIDNIDRDEMRSGFLVTSHRKKLWNVQIGIIKEFARICKKHNLRWFAHGGTLLGAIRHKGFIPWDDDADVALFRPDYEKFRKIVAEEVREPYFFDPWYNYKLESDEINGIHEEENLPRIPSALQKHGPAWWPFWPILRIKDSRTTCIVRQGLRNIPQQVYIDIFPYDPVPPFVNEQHNRIFETSKLLLTATIMPDKVMQNLEEGNKFIISNDEIQKFIRLSFRKRALKYEKFMVENYFTPQYLSEFKVFHVDNRPKLRFNIADFDHVRYATFEKVQLPIPVGYDDVLKACYGDWHSPKIFPTPVSDYSADISYSEYVEESGFMR